jgi:hypothetical protein
MKEGEPLSGDGTAPAASRPWQVMVALEGGGTDIARARYLAAGFLTRRQTEYGLMVSQRGLDLTQLVVGELVTNADA